MYNNKCIKVIVITFLVVTLSASTNAQVKEILDAVKPQKAFNGTPALQKKSQVLQIGIGFPNNVATLLDLGGLGSLFNSSTSNKIGPIFISYEYLIKENIGLGASLSYASAQKTYINPFSSSSTDKYTGKLSGVSLLLSTTYHFYITDKLDPYAKGSVGITMWKGSYKDATGTDKEGLILPTPVGYSGILGLKYFASKNTAPFGELSYSNLQFTANIGVAFKLR